MSTNNQQQFQAAKLPANKELRDAGQVINAFLLAWKNYGLYPEDHESTLNSIQNLVAAFAHFFSKYSDMRLMVEKDHLLYQSEMIHTIQQASPSEDIVTLLYRDGIKWIEFKKGLSAEEIASFFRIAHKYRLLAEETEGDIVTALMDEELECIDFKAVDIFWQDLLLMNFSQLPPPAFPDEKAPDPNKSDHSRQSVAPDSSESYARSIADPSFSDAQLELSDTDFRTLQQMIKEEERWDISDDLFELLLIILNNQNEQQKFISVLSFISDLIVETIEKEKFDLLVKLFQSLYTYISAGISSEQDWKRHHIERFFDGLSKPEIFQLLSKKLLQLRPNEMDTLEALEQALHYFSPDIIPYLIPVLTQRSSPEIKQWVSSVILYLSRRDPGPLEKIAEQHGREMGERLMPILTRLQGEKINEILFKMCQSASSKVRRNAIVELIKRDPEAIQKLFPLIDDPSREVRVCILAAVAKQRSSALESLLLNYLQENFDPKDPTHLLACYKALGCCGSTASVPFLRRILLSRGWNSFMGSGKAVFREGAAIALALLNIPEAETVLKKASKSRFKVVRKAFDETKTLSDLFTSNPHD